jgi:hypothetical protein
MTIDDLRIVNCSEKQRSSLEPPTPILGLSIGSTRPLVSWKSVRS